MSLINIAADLIAVGILVFVLFRLRSGRRELVAAYLTINVGVMAVTSTLSNSTVGVGLGLGLFGILSIIRLRSEELTQREIAYYFAALTLGLLGGIATSPQWLAPVLMAAIVSVVAIGDHPRVSPHTVSQELRLDLALADRDAVIAHVETMLGVEVVEVDIRSIDMVNDTTLVRLTHQGVTKTPSDAQQFNSILSEVAR
ncbi:MAG TPA: DUF4956 domain-containing protein [Aeromicrobium sp.]|nr:DUF4956 domain-containing protein [Aeromicrobium sp.]